MDQSKIGFDHWPFAKGERAKLIKISKPYSVAGKWFIDAVYLSKISKHVQKLNHFFGDLHLLIVGADYVDSKRQQMTDWDIVDINFSQQSNLYRSPAPYLHEDKFKKHEFDYYTVAINYKGRFFVIALYELLRAVLASDVFWLNQVTMLDSIDTRIIFGRNTEDLTLHFLPDVPIQYVKMDQKIKHMAWIFSNPEIYKMINQTYQNIINGIGIKFDFLFKELHLTAKAEVHDNKVYVKEIITCAAKKLNCSHIIVYHPRLVGYEKESGEKEKQWTNVEKNDGDTVLVNDKTATPGILDVEKEELVSSEYSSFAKIERIKNKKSGGTETTSHTKKVETDKKNNRTTGDTGGSDTVPQLEFEQHISEKLDGPFAEILEILKLMKDEAKVVSVGYHIGELNHHFQSRAICTLGDGITSRRYLVAIIRVITGEEAVLIEVNKEKLSTLMLVSCVSQEWDLICHNILKGFIQKSGSWPDFGLLEIKNLEICRFKHRHTDVSYKEERMVNFL